MFMGVHLFVLHWGFLGGPDTLVSQPLMKPLVALWMKITQMSLVGVFLCET